MRDGAGELNARFLTRTSTCPISLGPCSSTSGHGMASRSLPSRPRCGESRNRLSVSGCVTNDSGVEPARGTRLGRARLLGAETRAQMIAV